MNLCECPAGILMWEIFSGGESPYGKLKNADVVEGVCHRDLRPTRSPKCPEPIYNIMLACWNKVGETKFYGLIKIIKTRGLLIYFSVVVSCLHSLGRAVL